MGCTISNESKGEARRSKLMNITLKDTHQFSFEGLTTEAKVVDIYDGDTLRIAFYYKDEIVQTSCRCLDYDAPEMKLPKLSKNATSKEQEDRETLKNFAIKAKERLSGMLKNELVTINFFKNDLYGRPLVKIFVDGKYINQEMINEGYGKPYGGGHKNVWTVEDCK